MKILLQNSKNNTPSILKPSKAICLLLMVLFFSLFGNVVSAQTNTWDGSSDNNWNTAANWSLNAVPTAAHDVLINTNATIFVDNSNHTINSLTINGSTAVSLTSSGGGRTITIDNTGSSIGVGSSLTLQGSTGNGTRSMSIRYTGTNQTMSVAGTLILTDVGEGTIYNATNSITTVTGTIINRANAGGTLGVITSTVTNLIFASGGNYRHELNGGNIPTATWNVASNCIITGVTGTLPGGSSQNFGNLTWDCVGQTGTIFPVINIQGDLNIISTGTPANEGRPIDGSTHSVGGNFNQTGGNVRWARNTNSSLTVTGNVTITGGIFNMSNGSAIGTLNVTGDFNHTGGTITETGSASGLIVFNKAGTQTYTSGGTVANTINFTVNSGSTLQMATPSTVVTGNSFVLSAGATIGITSTAGITSAVGTATGNIRTTGTRSFNSGSSYIYNGSSAQVVGTGLPTTVSNLTISNPAGVTLAQATTVTNNFSIATGSSVNLGTGLNHTAGLLILGGEGTVPGSWGSTTSLATNKDNTYFAATSGIVNNSCSAPTITAQPSPLTLCENTGGSFSVTSTGGSTYQWQYSVNNGSSWTNTTSLAGFSGHTTATLTLAAIPLAYNGYSVRCIVRSSGGCRTNSNEVLLTVNSPSTPATKTWNGTAWLPAGAPTSDQNIEFAGNYEVATDITACSCTVTSGIVVIPTGNSLILGGKLTVSGGSLTFDNNASLVQTTYTGVNAGTIFYNRDTPPIFNTDYTYWSSPIASGYKLGQLSPNTLEGMFYSFNAGVENWEQEYTTTAMNVGVGYIVRGPEPIAPNPPTQMSFNGTFEGVPNNGSIPVNIMWNGDPLGTSNLIGNPYPSAIDADAFLSANSTVIDGTVYFWTHNTGRINGQYNNDDYASYNTTGGVGTGNFVNGVEQTANKPTGKIAAGQAFFATGIAAGAVTFTNDMRVAGVTGNNSQFFKTRNPNGKTAQTKAIEKNRVWLNMTNTEGAFKQTLVGYITDATNNYDNRFDGESFDGNEFLDFYSVNQDKNLVIQGRALPFDEKDEVPLGYRTTIDGVFTINIAQADGLLTNQDIFIEDKLTNTLTNLKSGNYTFSTTPGTFNDRFVLRYTNKTLATNTYDSLENKVLVSNKNKQLTINSFAETIDKVVIYDLLGRQIYQKDKVDSIELSIANLVSSHQTLIVKTILQNGHVVNSKIIL